MDPIAVKVLDPTGQPYAQLLDPLRPVHELLSVLVHRLNLPEGPRYELVREYTGGPLPENRTLDDAGVRAGESLRVRPVRDDEFDAFLVDLYEEAAKLIAAELVAQASALLEALYRLDPQFPDRLGLWRKIATRGGPSAAGPAASGPAAGPPKAPRRTPGSAAPGPAPAPQAPVSSAPAPRTGSAAGCLVVLVFGAVLVGVALWLNGSLAEFGLPRPGDGSPLAPGPRPGEPVLGTGDVQATLRWDTSADLDLHVTDPSGQTVSYRTRSVPSGGQLDVDAHAGCTEEAPVENVFWPTGGAPSGSYIARVHYYGACSAGPSGYELTVRVDGRVVEQRTGTLGAPGEETTVSFTR
jgi:hypothetical protein